ncbi:MAG: hypothetical protein KA054_00095 [Candidatus Moranbacteria bacterium]|nr:hypothetical protein [Candidatus Moranbacteria bacterium]
METTNHFKKALIFFALSGMSISVFIWFSLLLGTNGLFFTPFIIFGFSLLGTFFVFLSIKMLFYLDIPERFFILLLVAIALISILPTKENPSVFTGRDQGSIATAAIALTEYHSFSFSIPVTNTFSAIHEPGIAQNFPGFFYTNEGKLLTQFPLAYTAWLASFFTIFHLNGFAIANSILFALSLISFYFLLRPFLERLLSFLGTLLFATSFLPVWFGRFTLTENLALFLFLFLSFSLIQLKTSGRFIYYASALSAAGVLCLTRIEGCAIFLISLFLMARMSTVRHIWGLYPKKSILIPAILFVLTSVGAFSESLPFLTTILKAAKNFTTEIPTASSALISTHSPLITLLILFFLYGLLLIFFLGFSGTFLLLKRKEYTALIPIFLALPTFAYFLFPNITPDHPWMLRRYLPTIYPALMFTTLIGLALLFEKKKTFPIDFPRDSQHRLIFTLILIGLFVFQIPAWQQGLLTFENHRLLEKTKDIAGSFGPKDLILIDRNVSGSPFAMIAGPLASLYHKNAVYFFDPTDLRKIDRSPYEHVWLIVPTDRADEWKQALSEYRLRFDRTIPIGSISLGSFPSDQKTQLRFPEVSPFGNVSSIFEIE